MGKQVMALAVAAGCVWHAAAVAAEVPAVTAAEFSGASSDASALWLILAGEGTWGAMVLAILGVIWKVARPYLQAWTEKRRLDRLFLAVETGVAGCKALYTDEMKKANADGRLTVDEVEYVRGQCRDYIVCFMAAQGVDALKEYGPRVIDMLCEWMLARLKADNAATRAVVPPLPDLAF